MKHWKRSRKFNRHHLRPKSRGGSGGKNLLRMDTERHKAWHLLFQNLDLDEIIELLQRVKKLKASH